MHKSKKGGIAIEEVVGVLIVIFVAVILTFLFKYLNYLNESKISDSVSTEVERLEAHNNLIKFIKSSSGDGIISDNISREYIVNNQAKLASISNDFFKNIYNSYDVIIGGKSINNIHFTGQPISSFVTIPLENRYAVSIEFYVGQEGVTGP